jgi:hypothetical protein
MFQFTSSLCSASVSFTPGLSFHLSVSGLRFCSSYAIFKFCTNGMILSPNWKSFLAMIVVTVNLNKTEAHTASQKEGKTMKT